MLYPENVYQSLIRIWSRLTFISIKAQNYLDGEQGSISTPWELVPPELEVTEKEDTADWQQGHMKPSV